MLPYEFKSQTKPFEVFWVLDGLKRLNQIWIPNKYKKNQENSKTEIKKLLSFESFVCLYGKTFYALTHLSRLN